MAYLLELHDKIVAAENAVARAKQVVAEKTDELNSLKELVWYCPQCKKNYPKESVTRSFGEVTRYETVYIDAGYGDDDELAEVTRLVTYLQCPVCGEQFAQGQGQYLREANRHTRR